MTEPTRYWFKAKRYGWGWGPPVSWHGWVVLLAYVLLLALGSVLLVPARHLGWHFVYVTALSGVLIAICYAKGEPPKWRWGR